MIKPKKIYTLKRSPIKRRTPLKRSNYRLKRTPIKKKRKSSEEIEEERKEQIKMWNFFLKIWEERAIDGRHYSEVSGERIYGEPLTIYFEHLIEKSPYPEYKYAKWNIAIVTADEHTAKNNGFPLPKHKELIDRAWEVAKKIKEVENGDR